MMLVVGDDAFSGDRELLHIHFYSDPFSVGETIGAIIERVGPARLSPEQVSQLEIVLVEITNNIIEHAYQEHPDGQIEVVARLEPEGLWFRFTDRGLAMPGMAIPQARQHDLDCPEQELPEGGWGWLLIRSLARGLVYQRHGEENRLTFRFPLGRERTRLH